MNTKTNETGAAGGGQVDAVVTLAEHQGWNKKK